MLKQIVAVDENWGIGRDNDLLFSIPEDMKFFRTTTQGKAVVMGYNTLLSLPGGRPLKNRFNIVLSRKAGLCVPGAVVCGSVEQLGGLLGGLDEQDVFVMGGCAVYTQLLPYSAMAYVTRVEADGHAALHYPNVDAEPGWQLAAKGEEKQHEGLRFRFCEYQNTNVLPLPGADGPKPQDLRRALDARMETGITADDLRQAFGIGGA